VSEARHLQAAEAERVILAGCLLAGNASPLGELQPDDFRLPNNQFVAQAIIALSSDGKLTELPLVCEWLSQYKPTVPASYVSGLLDGAVSLDYVPYRERVLEASKYRAVIREANDVILAAQKGQPLERIQFLADRARRSAETDFPARTAPEGFESSRLISIGTNTTTLWEAGEFARIPLRLKEPLVDGMLYRRDLVGFIGRRREGKTAVCLNLSVRLACGQDFLGFTVASPRRVLALFLEDDAREIQARIQKLGPMEQASGKLFIATRNDFAEIPLTINGDGRFCRGVRKACDFCHPDLVVFDNVSHLIGADFNNSKIVHETVMFARSISQDFNAAVILCAHPRKRPQDGSSPIRLRKSPSIFFEEVLGSSHFINSCGSLWGIERDWDSDLTDFVAGAQRSAGRQELSILKYDEDTGWFSVLQEHDQNLELLLSTEKRRAAWQRLPQKFTFAEGQTASGLSKGAFHSFWQEAKRLGLLKQNLLHWEKATK
jgi:hypothetical protein